MTEISVFSIISDPIHPASPIRKNAGQHRVPKWYSDLMTIGWNRPMQRKLVMPSMMPWKFMVS